MTDRTDPTGSGRGADGLRESGTSRVAHTRPATANGTLTQNTEPHQKCSRRRPPATGPMAIPSPLVAARTPIALRRSPGSRNMSVMIDRVDGIIIAAPAPIRPVPR